jgi:hypothetical protein
MLQRIACLLLDMRMAQNLEERVTAEGHRLP